VSDAPVVEQLATPDPATTPWVPLWALNGGIDLRYWGDYAPGSYTDGDVVVYNGVPYICVRPTTATPSPWPLPGVDSAWHVVGAASEPAFTNGYAAWDARAPRFRKLSSGAVVLGGIVKCPAAQPSPVTLPAFTLPVGYRPVAPYDLTFWVNGTGSPVLANVAPGGPVYFTSSPAGAYPLNNWIYLDGVHFFADA
jgi:hypothetical protein